MVGLLEWLKDLIINGAAAFGVITEPIIDLGNGQVYTMLTLLTVGGLVTYLGVALIKWLIS